MLTLSLVANNFGLPTVVFADDPVVAAVPDLGPSFPTNRFPSHVSVIIDGERYEAFNLGGFRALLQLDADLYYALQERAIFRDQRDLCLANSQTLQVSLNLANEQLTISNSERNRLLSAWTAENLARHTAENRPNMGSWVGWSLASGLTISTLILTAIVIVKERNDKN